jgi:hypothetical protein
VTLNKLREKILADNDIKAMFLKHFPQLSFEQAVEDTLIDLYEYAIEKDYDVLSLSLKGAELFFSAVLSNIDSDDEELEEEQKEDDSYGKA